MGQHTTEILFSLHQYALTFSDKFLTVLYLSDEELSSQPLLCAMLLHPLSLDMLVVASIQGMVV